MLSTISKIRFSILHLQMTIQEASRQLISDLSALYDKREATSIADMVMENLTGWKKIDLIIKKQDTLPEKQEELLKRYTGELISNRPVQYVLGEAWFYGMKFFVDENVLIPRPETEELVEWVLKEMGKGEKRNTEINPQTKLAVKESLSVLDIGSGSGCIPIALKKELPDTEIYSCDISKNALRIARQNAGVHNANIHFFELDFLNKDQRAILPEFHILISNPPYIPLKEKSSLGLNITGYEPRLALFVPDDSPLIFYEAIADFAKEKIAETGSIFVEIHEDFSASVKKLFSFKGFSTIEIKKDLQGKERMLKATMLL
jgi:release factor glutamine methyltransferase